MRVTQNMISNNMLHNLNKSYAQMDKYFDQLTTGKRINKPSEDPVAGMNALGYRSELARLEQYQRNTGELHNWYDNTDAALDQITSGLQRVRELAVQASNSTYEGTQLNSIAEEVNEIKEDIEDVANTKVGDKYIFNGTSVNDPPIKDNGEINFHDGDFKITVSGETELAANLNGEEVFSFNDEDGKDLFSVLDSFIGALREGEGANFGDRIIEDIDGVMNNVVNERAELGARMNRLELVENRLSQQEIVATQMVSDNEDVDYAEAITNLITQESIHRSALSSGARIIQPSLLDFLR